jgi:hypothetical protein
MSKPSNAVKQRWNASHYTQIKVSVNPETAQAFKAACRTAGVSVAGVLERYMRRYAGSAGDLIEGEHGSRGEASSTASLAPPKRQPMTTIEKSVATVNVKTLNDRRKAMALICSLLDRLIDSETDYMDNMPVNLQQGEQYERALERAERLTEALDVIEGIGEL